jgi:RNA polymerase sigma-B factor
VTPAESVDRDGAAARSRAANLLLEMHALPAGSPLRRRLRDQVAEAHLSLVEYLARRFTGRSEPFPDLVQVGAIGLLKAIDRFEPDRGVEFSSYATPTILGEIKRHFRDTGWLVHVPRRAQELQAPLATARADLSQELHRSPTVAELATRAQVTEEEVVEALDVARAYAGLPLNPPGGSDADSPVVASLAEFDEGLDRVEQRALLRPAIATLSAPEREVLLLRFVAGRSQTEIAAQLGATQMQISRMIARSLARLRDELS